MIQTFTKSVTPRAEEAAPARLEVAANASFGLSPRRAESTWVSQSPSAAALSLFQMPRKVPLEFILPRMGRGAGVLCRS